MAEPETQVSVLIPCWNAVGTITRALDSVLVEKDFRVACIVVDDGSTDGTADVVQAIADRDPRVVLARAPANAGVSAARNLGLPLLQGDWMTFLDSDDRLMPGGLAALVSKARTTDALAIIGQRIWSDGETTWITKLYDQPDIRVPGRKSLVRNPGLLFYASGTGKLFHRSIIEGLTFEGRVLGDQPWTLRALLRAGDRIEVIDDLVYEWTRPAPGQTVSTITLAKRGSAALAADAVLVAIGALRDVGAEADRVLADEASRQMIRAAYFDRLVRADFSGPVERALETRDPGTDKLFEALAAFIVAAPAGIAEASRPLVDRVLWPPVVGWGRMPRSARRAYWTMARPLLRPGAELTQRLHHSRSAALAAGMARRYPVPGGMAAADLVLTLGYRRRARSTRRG